MKSWKTSLLGLIAAFAGFVTFSPDLFVRWPWVVAISKYIMVGGLAGIGFAAKDSDVHSTVAETKAATIEQIWTHSSPP